MPRAVRLRAVPLYGFGAGDGLTYVSGVTFEAGLQGFSVLKHCGSRSVVPREVVRSFLGKSFNSP